jgi:GAF domain-containing protein
VTASDPEPRGLDREVAQQAALLLLLAHLLEELVIQAARELRALLRGLLTLLRSLLTLHGALLTLLGSLLALLRGLLTLHGALLTLLRGRLRGVLVHDTDVLRVVSGAVVGRGDPRTDSGEGGAEHGDTDDPSGYLLHVTESSSVGFCGSAKVAIREDRQQTSR